MSDEEYEYEYDSQEEYDYGSEQDEVEDELVEIENVYYEADDCRQEDPQRAIELFEQVVELEKNKSSEIKWRFKALQHLVTLYFQLSQFEKMVAQYELMLQQINSVTRNESTDAINSVLDTVSASTNWSALTKIYEVTLNVLKDQNNERLWFNTNLKLARVYLESQSFNKVENLIDELKRACQKPDGSDDPTKGSNLLEVYALEIQYCSVIHDTARMRDIYPKTLNLNAAVSDPRVMGIIREEGGVMYMANAQWLLAYHEFNEAFRNYQEAGNPRARACLKYVVLANMLALSDINPFAAREAKVYQDDREIVAVMDLRQAYESNDLPKFERVLNNTSNHIADDPFMMTYIEPLRRRMHEQVLVNITQPYRKCTLDFLSQELRLSVEDVEKLLVDMILEERLQARIDQISGYVLLGGERSSSENRKAQSLKKWASVLESVVGHMASM